MGRKSKYPAWFSKWSKPTLYAKKPEEILTNHIQIHRIKLEDGDEFDPSSLQSDLFYRVSTNTNYDECYYPGDSPSVECYLVGYRLEEIPNPKYDKEISDYNRRKKEHQGKLKEWKILKKISDEEDEAAKIMGEMEQLKKLKEKYENQKL